MAADLLTTIRAEIDARLSELGPLLAEHERLLSAEGALTAEGRSAKPRQLTQRAAAATATRSGRVKVARPKVTRAKAAGLKAARAKAGRPQAAGAKAGPPKAGRPAGKRARGRPSFGVSGQAILAALDHGSHTIAELVVVTALPTPDIRHGLRSLLKRKAIVKTDRDGKTAYALAG